MQKTKKDRLRSIARQFSERAIIEVARGMPAKESIDMTDDIKKEVKRLYCEIFETTDLKDIPLPAMMGAL